MVRVWSRPGGRGHRVQPVAVECRAAGGAVGEARGRVRGDQGDGGGAGWHSQRLPRKKEGGAAFYSMAT